MADYAIGDVQGCYDQLMQLLDKIQFNERLDRLWFVGDLINRGPQSLAVLRFVKALSIAPVITLGNHDLHLLDQLFGRALKKNQDDTLKQILMAPDAQDLGHWLRKQSILHYDKSLNVVVTHAGIPPIWDLAQAMHHAQTLEKALQGPEYSHFLKHMYGNTPHSWSEALAGVIRLRVICNYFTRMRLCDIDGGLDFNFKGPVASAPTHLYPWYAWPGRKAISASIVFGHWAALSGHCPKPNIYAIDTGCLWGGELTALRLQDKKRFSVAGLVQ